MELIDRAALGVGRCNPEVMRERAYAAGWNGLLGILNNAPVIDAVPVVRCGECVYKERATVNEKRFLICPTSHMEITDDDFCSYGERREADHVRNN